MTRSRPGVAVVTALVLATFSAFGQTPARGDITDTQAVTSPVTPAATTVTDTPALAAERARQWDLTEDEYTRYRKLMDGVRGSFSDPRISPLEVLGIHADSPERQRHYAERLVRLMRADTQRVLDFQRAVDAAWDRLYPNEAMFDVAALPPEHRPFNTDDLAGERLVAFVSAAEASSPTLGRLLALAGRDGASAGLDLYVIDAGDDDAIRAWARDAGIDPALVRSRRITLNDGFMLYTRMGRPGGVPQVYRRDGDELIAVPSLSASEAAR